MKYKFIEKYDDKYKLGDKEIAGYSRSGIKDAHPDGNYRVIGETKKNNKKNNKKKEIGTIELGGRELKVSKEGSHSKLLYRRASYIQDEKTGDYIALLKPRFLLLWIPLGLAVAGTALALLLNPAAPPDGEKTVDSETVESEFPDEPPSPPDIHDVKVETDTVYISIPSGNVDYRLKNDIRELEGAELEIYMKHDGCEEVVHRQTVRLKADGDMENGVLDFPSLTFELVAGDYEGRMVYTMPDGKETEYQANILIRSSKTGQMTIGYSDVITVDKKAGTVKLFYDHGENATHNVILQVIAKKDGKELLLAQSGTVRAGESINELALDENAKSYLAAGQYDG